MPAFLLSHPAFADERLAASRHIPPLARSVAGAETNIPRSSFTVMSELENIIGQDAIDSLDQPIESALGLPGSVYWSPEVYRLERERLFPRAWVAAAMGSEIPNPGDVLPVEVVGWPLVFVRDRSGELRCFHNICRHRGAAVVPDTASDCHVLRCPWHGWTYELDGTLKGAPEFAGPGDHRIAGFDPATSGLKPVRMAQWFDFLFVNLDGEASSIEDSLSPLTQRFAAFDFDRFRHAGDWNIVYEGNWKVAVEGALENYHLPRLHSQVHQGKRPEVNRTELASQCFYCMVSEWEHHVSGRRRVADDSVAQLPTLPVLEGMNDADGRSNFFLNIFPTGVMGFTSDHLYAGVWLPDGPARTHLRFHYYFVGDAASDPGLSASRQHVIDSMQEVFEQDAPVAKAVQDRAARRDELGLRTRFSPYWETAVLQFQRDVVAALES